MNKKILALAVCIMAIPVLATAQSVYKWTDEEGVTHFGDRQPSGTQSESVSIRTGKQSGSSPASPQQKIQQIDEQEAENEERESMSAAEEAREKQRAANCETARNNLALIRTGSRIKAQGDDGEERYLSSDEIEEKRAQFEEIAELNCGDAEES